MVNILCFLFFIIILSILLPSPFSFQREQMHDLIAFQAIDNLYILPISTFRDIITQNECLSETIIEALFKAFSMPSCFSNIYFERLLSNVNKNDAIINEQLFRNYLSNCTFNEVKTIPLKNAALSRIKNSSGGIRGSLSTIYPYCMQNIINFLNGSPKCVIPSHYTVIDKIINKCSDEAFSKLNLTFLPSKSPISTYIDDLENLESNKIGLILDIYTKSKLSLDIIKIFGNLTYEEFDALKMMAIIDSHLKQLLCDSKDDSKISKYFKSIKSNINLMQSPQIPKKIKNIFFKTFTPEILEAVKAMLKVHPHFRWSFCSQILAISPSKELTNIFSPPVTKWAIQNCQIMARNHSSYHSAICGH